MSTPNSGTPSPTPQPAETAPAETKEQKAKRRLWDIIITAMPVLLTVLATALVSKSAAEMTKAQYHRAVAAQTQAKVGDQWSFFQAKRIRGTIQSIKAERGAFNPQQLQMIADRLPDSLKQLSDEAAAVLAQLNGGIADGSDSKTAWGSLQKAVERLKERSDKAAEAAAKARANANKMMSKPEIQETMPFLTKKNLPLPRGVEKVEDTRVIVRAAVTETLKELLKSDEKAEEETKRLYEVMADIEKRAPRSKYEAQLTKITPQVIHAAQEAAEARAEEFDSASKTANKVLRDFDGVLSEQRDLLRPVEEAAFEVQATQKSLPRQASMEKKTIVEAVNALVASADHLNRMTRDLNARFVASQNDFDVRRYEREARFNQAIAGLYEVQVRKSAFESDEAMHRKDMYMYGMLAAQAGVVVATFALAVRFKGVLFALAVVAGVIAIFLMGMGMGLLALVGMNQ
jgi:hypothetical protein